MGQEIAQWAEWNHDGEVDWACLGDDNHAGMQALIRDLNRLYTSTPRFTPATRDPEGFQWIEGGDTRNSVFSWIRQGEAGDPPVAVICNFTPQEQTGYRIGLPHTASGARR